MLPRTYNDSLPLRLSCDIFPGRDHSVTLRLIKFIRRLITGPPFLDGFDGSRLLAAKGAADAANLAVEMNVRFD